MNDRDEELESMIDRAGRAAVFERARQLGWMTANAPPRWIWYQIAAEILRDISSVSPDQSTLST